MKYFDYYSSPLGTMLIIEENNALTHLTLSDNTQVLSNFPADSLQQKSSSVISSAKI